MRLLAHEIDDQTGIVTRVWLDEATGERIDEQVQDAQEIVDLAHAMASMGQPGRDLRAAALVPPLVMAEWMKAHTEGKGPAPWDPEWSGWLNRKLNDIDYRKFRVWGGQL